ncbi:MAG TPA: leucine-rich repeat domain-containing protein [Ruminiclostridium sp.]|nr:leucine-rich repeat domain-containing protein [Ruminiclostridium sp.]
MKSYKIFICGLLVLAMAFSLVSPFTIDTQAATRNQLELHAFYPAYATFSDKLKKFIDPLDSISFAWGRLYGDLTDGINTTYGENGNKDFYYPKDYADVLKYSKSKNKSIQLSIYSDNANAVKILPYKDQREKAEKAVTDLLQSDASNGSNIYFDGVVMDIEGLQNKDSKGKDVLINGQTISAWYTQFLKELKTQLTAIHKKLYVAVNPLLYFDGYNYSAIAQTADRMIIMAHDYEPVVKLTKGQVLQYTGYDSLDPIDSLAPIKKVQRTLEDVKKYVSKDNLYKIELQISFDTAQWKFQIANGSTWSKTGKQAESLRIRDNPSYQQIYDRIKNKDGNGTAITYSYNNELESPVMQYFNTADHTQNIALYENGRSVKAKMDIAKQYGIGGISLWNVSSIPDYTDSTAKAYGLDVWDSIVKSLPVAAPAAQIKVTFADKVVETAVRERISKPAGTVYKSDLEKVYRLSVPAGYKTLNDLKQLTNLEYLNLSSTKLTGVSALSPLKNLRVLYLKNNSIKDISPLRALTKLEILWLDGNKVSNISCVAGMTQLAELYIRNNSITDYSPVAKLQKLNTLYIKGNKSTNYSKLQTIKKSLAECDF